jgi:hypothetical protein
MTATIAIDDEQLSSLMQEIQEGRERIGHLEEALAQAKARTRWIAVTDAIPHCRMGALVFVHRPITFANPIGRCEFKVAEFDGERFDVEHVTHWMPLPEVPGARRQARGV